MFKKAETVEKVEDCKRCPFSNGGWCHHPNGWKVIEAHNIIPTWCPLEDWIDE